jgi:predicted neuraminidase
MYYSQTNINQTLIEDQALGIWVTRGLTFPYSWGPLFPFYMNPGASTRGRIIETSTGLLLPAYDSSTSFMLALDSLGRTWNIINMSGAESLAQPTLVRLDNTTIMCFLNNMENGDIYTSRSTDEGLTWTPPKFNMISNSGISSAAYQLASGAIVMVFGSAYISPSPLVVALSYDGGDTWPYTRVLQNQDGTEEFSYPSVLQDNEGYIHVAYTYNRLTIKYMRITEKWIRH